MDTTVDDAKRDIEFFLHKAYKEFMKGNLDTARRYITQALFLEDSVVIYRCVRRAFPDE